MTELIVMRLADMTKFHPDQITAKCHGCGHDVAVYPSGQKAMRQYPGIKLMCQVCAGNRVQMPCSHPVRDQNHLSRQENNEPRGPR